MIGKITIGRDFYGVLAYNEKKVSEQAGYVIDSNIDHSSTVEMTTEFNLIRQLRPNLGNAVFHVSLNLPYSDSLNDKEFASLGNDYLMKMGFDDNQYVMYRHIDTRHEHIHIIANRVRYSGRITSDSNIKRRSREVINYLENKYGLTQIPAKANNKRSLTQKEIEKTLRTGQVPIKMALQKNIDTILSKAKNTSGFMTMLEQQGISPKFNVSKTTGRVSGISFDYQGVIYKGSTLGKKYSWNSIVKYIDYEQDRDRQVILSANGKERATDAAGKRNNRATVKARSRNHGHQEGTEDSSRQPRGYLEKIKGYGIVGPLMEETEWNAFKLEVTDFDARKKSRRKKKKRGLGH
ncbi:relaxase/mobilization nuclease domain-containing protein [Flagellimonas onchidii]|uniref:relaxase/mobilization nuclease domain-containing protein n=1 Tax=Flagellimonas onchidii TaxID=2562684 RepID=UPI0010A668A2|nr:relaxase/mobilization nuclease domain-containing protein [Allomuricauda onchidii]